MRALRSRPRTPWWASLLDRSWRGGVKQLENRRWWRWGVNQEKALGAWHGGSMIVHQAPLPPGLFLSISEPLYPRCVYNVSYITAANTCSPRQREIKPPTAFYCPKKQSLLSNPTPIFWSRWLIYIRVYILPVNWATPKEYTVPVPRRPYRCVVLRNASTDS